MLVDRDSDLTLTIHDSTSHRVILTRPGKNAEEWKAGSLPTKNMGRHQVVVIDRQHRPLVAELVGKPGRANPERKAVGPLPQVTIIYWVR